MIFCYHHLNCVLFITGHHTDPMRVLEEGYQSLLHHARGQYWPPHYAAGQYRREDAFCTLYWDNGKSNGNYYNGLYKDYRVSIVGYIGRMGKNMETCIFSFLQLPGPIALPF